MAASTQSSRFAQLIQNLQAQGRGTLRLDVLEQDDLLPLLAAAIGGDEDAYCLSRMAEQVMQQIATAPKRLPWLCASCPRPVRNRPFALVLVRPVCDAPTVGTGLTVCRSCASTPETIQAKAIATMRKVWPKAHMVSPHPGSGARH